MKYQYKKWLKSGLCLAAAMTFVWPADSKICHAAEKESGWETPSGITAGQIESTVDEVVKDYMGSTVKGAAIAIVKDGKMVFEKGYGDAGADTPVEPKTTVFEYGSVTKLFTWVSAMQLAEQGKLDLNADVTQYLPSDFEVPVHTPITMMNLMNHTAGFDDYGIGLMTREDNYTDFRTALEEQKVKQINEPGTICSYSNYGAGLAGYLVETIAGEEEYSYVRQHIFDVLGMKDVTMSFVNDPIEQLEENKSLGYEMTSDGKIGEGRWSYIPMYAAGEGNGTIEELAKFAIGLMDKNSGLFEHTDTYDTMLTNTYRANDEIVGSAHGFFEYEGEYKTYWHNGETNDFTTFFAIVPEADFAVVVSANTKSPECSQMVHTLGWMMVQKKEVVMLTPKESLPSTKEVAGKYCAPRRFHHGISQMMYLVSPYDLKVEVVNDQEITINGDKYKQVKPYVYQDEESGDLSAFGTDNGKVTSYTFIQGYQKNSAWSGVKYGLTYVIGALGILSFLASIAYQLIHIFNRERKVRKVLLGLQAAWLIYVFNTIDVACKILTGARYGELQVQLYVNLGLGLGMFGASAVMIARYLKNQEGKLRAARIWGMGYYTIQILMLVMLACWGGFQFTA